MNYSALIQNRKSVREFTGKKVPATALAVIGAYYQNFCNRLVPELETKLCVFGEEAREALEGAAGYENYLVGAPNYLVLLSAKGDLAGENAGFIIGAISLKKIPYSVHPSIRPASIRDLGNPSRYWRKKNIVDA